MTQYSFNVNGQSVIGKTTWNTNGTLQKLVITDPFNTQDNQICTYSYDDLARTSGTTCTAWTQTFTYDPLGNITKGGNSAWQPIYNSPANDGIPTNNQYKTGWNGVSYDASGNLLNDTFNTYTWDGYGSLASANGASIVYDAFGKMVENANGSNQFVYAPAGGPPLARMQGQTLNLGEIPLPGGAFALYLSAGIIQYNHPDWLGSARLVSTPSRGPLPNMAYAPFGEGYAGPSQFVQFTSTGNTWTVYDTENQTGSLEDFTFRRYSPSQGRWISPDPAGMAAANSADPQSWNRYLCVERAAELDRSVGPCSWDQ
jgi:RHS repeat-associated protein